MKAIISHAILGFAGIWSVASAAMVDAASISIAASKDNTLYETVDGSLSNGSGEWMFVGSTQTATARRSLVAFDVAAVLPANAVVQSASLQLYMSKTISDAIDVSVHRVTSDWGEGASDATGSEGGGAAATTGDATWLHAFSPSVNWTAAGGDFVSTPSATASIGSIGSYVWASTPQLAADVQAWLNNPSQNYGWELIGGEAGSGNSKRFDSRQSSIEANRPALVVEYSVVPEPTAAVLGAIGLLAAAGRRRSQA
ncbi:MAG: PEP-CTERM sorting domain-containing protein [Planctomycetales bacterium]|nr:PEP-CTERM sorting domain-containing protein [Planctomycetales bacterium]